ncbi:septum formation protein Maf [Chitinophaga oryzae]|uniref:dTTP/UTP pyrophosphatase n=1 Tax=Chitinophaga oryzae TaxID=2725414 RepID=A0AAE7DBM1_9BACT|nr:Maf family protein [Chitinophaga oryzae]QJB35644.1 septum formation protein Maf [Chitinophaga oryzae]QJB42181.1 septum formation protein Maf [Chitinophaga oryzae]
MYQGAPVVLASQSPRRKQLLEQAGIPFEVRVVETAETYPPGLATEQIPVHIAQQKAEAVASLCQPEEIVIAADTVVVLDETIIGKPKDRDDAVRILTALSGREHRVITGVVIRCNGKEKAFSQTTTVHFKPLSHEQVTYYVDNFKPYDKAGAYAIQEWIGAVGIDSIHGCFYNVMGLPISKVAEELHRI